MWLQVRALNSQLAELSDDRARTEERLNSLQKSLGEVEEDKRGLGTLSTLYPYTRILSGAI